jgi:hypothetical protein
MDKIKLKELIKKAIALNEKKNAVGKVPGIGLTVHVDSTYDEGTKQLTISVSNQSAKAPEYIVPDVADEGSVQEIVSGLESELGAAVKAFSRSVDKILSKYQQ